MFRESTPAYFTSLLSVIIDLQGLNIERLNLFLLDNFMCSIMALCLLFMVLFQGPELCDLTLNVLLLLIICLTLVFKVWEGFINNKYAYLCHWTFLGYTTYRDRQLFNESLFFVIPFI